MIDQKEQRIPIAILTGKGTRIGPTLQRAYDGLIPVQITSVISHNALLKDGSDVEGITLAKKLGFRTENFNLVQMTNIAKEKAERKKEPFDPLEYREKRYFQTLAEFICQKYPVRPIAVFMNGWDLVVPQEFMDYFPTKVPDKYNVINYHPTALPEEFGAKSVTLPSGISIPVIEGEETDVFNKALDLKLPAIGATMHYAQIIADAGGSVIETVEVPIFLGDDYTRLRERHIEIESEFMASSIDRWARQQLNR